MSISCSPASPRAPWRGVVLAGLCLLTEPLFAGHVDDAAYPYVVEVTVELTSQEKFYLVDPQNPYLFHETTTTRLGAYRLWGSGLVGTQNDPAAGGPHGPLRDLGLLVHEMGANRDGESSLELRTAGAQPRLRLHQDTVLVGRDGQRTPDIELDVEFDVQLGHGQLTGHGPGPRTTVRPTEAGEAHFQSTVRAMVERLLLARRAEMDAALADNGLAIVAGSERHTFSFPGTRGLRLTVDGTAGVARLRLPDMRLFMTARVEQNYDDRTNTSR